MTITINMKNGKGLCLSKDFTLEADNDTQELSEHFVSVVCDVLFEHNTVFYVELNSSDCNIIISIDVSIDDEKALIKLFECACQSIEEETLLYF